MNIMVMDTDLKTIHGVVDSFESFIWTDRYCKYGDFEIYLPATVEFIELFQLNRYVLFSETTKAMIIEKIEINTDAEKGDHMIVSGRSFESVLDRRIVWEQTIVSGDVYVVLRKLLRANILATATLFPRRIPELDLDPHWGNVGLRVSAQFTGDSLYDAVVAICEALGLGFVIYFDNTYRKFFFRTYTGIDRSISQNSRSPVIFSPYYDNLIDSNYVANSENYKNSALVLGEGEGSDRVRMVVDPEDPNVYGGLDRRELYVDARDLSRTTADGELTQQEYEDQLKQRGLEKLADLPMEYVFDGTIDYNSTFKPNVDFKLGDIVTVQNKYGLYENCRVSEMIYSINDTENVIYPSFERV